MLEPVFAILECLSGPIVTTRSRDCATRPGRRPRRCTRCWRRCWRVEPLNGQRGRYRLGMRLWLLGSGVPEARKIRDAALPHMVDLYAATRKTVVLGYPHGDDVLLANPIAGNAADPAWRSNRRMQLGACAPGLVYLAHMDQADLTERLAKTSLGLPESLRREEFWLLQVLAEIRHTGLASTWVEGEHMLAPRCSTPSARSASMLRRERRPRRSGRAEADALIRASRRRPRLVSAHASCC